MIWYAWAIVALLVLGAIANILLIDRPRGPITHGSAVANVIVNVLIIWGVVSLAT